VVVVDGNNREKSRVTDSGGAFCFDRLAAGWYRIIVLEPGETRRQSRLGRVHSPVGPGAPGAAENTMQVVEAGEVVRTFTVERGVRVEGTVHGIGEPPTLCRIIFRPYEPLRSRITSGVVQEPGTTNRDRGTCPDGEGRYCIDSVKSGQYKVSLRVLGHRGQRQGSYIVLSRIVDIPRVPTLMLDLNLPSGSISGRVLSPEMDRDLASLPRMRITRTDGDDRYVRTLQVNDDGTYTFDHLRPGTYGIMVFKSDTWAAMSRPGVRVEQGVQVTGVDFQLLSGVVAAGVVVDETGRPVARASVRAVPEGEEARRLNPFGHGRTRSDGTFSIAQLLPGTYAFRAHKLRRHSETIKVVIPEKGGTSNIRLVLNQGMR